MYYSKFFLGLILLLTVSALPLTLDNTSIVLQKRQQRPFTKQTWRNLNQPKKQNSNQPQKQNSNQPKTQNSNQTQNQNSNQPKTRSANQQSSKSAITASKGGKGRASRNAESSRGSNRRTDALPSQRPVNGVPHNGIPTTGGTMPIKNPGIQSSFRKAIEVSDGPKSSDTKALGDAIIAMETSYDKNNIPTDSSNNKYGKTGDAAELGLLKTGLGSIKYINQRLKSAGKPTIDINKIKSGDPAEAGKLWSSMVQVTGSTEAALILNKGGTGAYDEYKRGGWNGLTESEKKIIGAYINTATANAQRIKNLPLGQTSWSGAPVGGQTTGPHRIGESGNVS
jgi:hypothetical protein